MSQVPSTNYRIRYDDKHFLCIHNAAPIRQINKNIKQIEYPALIYIQDKFIFKLEMSEKKTKKLVYFFELTVLGM